MASKKVLTRQDALEILSNMAKATVTDLLDTNLNIDSKKLKKHKHALRELTIKPTKDGNQLQIKMYDKKAIIEQLANLQGWKDKDDNANIDTLQEFLKNIIHENIDNSTVQREYPEKQINFMEESYEA